MPVAIVFSFARKTEKVYIPLKKANVRTSSASSVHRTANGVRIMESGVRSMANSIRSSESGILFTGNGVRSWENGIRSKGNVPRISANGIRYNVIAILIAENVRRISIFIRRNSGIIKTNRFSVVIYRFHTLVFSYFEVRRYKITISDKAGKSQKW
jgi:hypothetical protein